MEMSKYTEKEVQFIKQTSLVGEVGMQKLDSSKVLILFQGKLGKEIGKNLVLSGIGHVSLGYWKEEISLDSIIQDLKELNETVTVEKFTEKISVETLAQKKFDVIIFANVIMDKEFQKFASNLRDKGIKVICGEARGLSCFLFVDPAQNEYTYLDAVGKPFLEVPVKEISPEKRAIETEEKVQWSVHRLKEGNCIVLCGDQNTRENQTFRIKEILENDNSSTLILEDGPDLPQNFEGNIKRVEEKKTISMKSMVETFETTNLVPLNQNIWNFFRVVWDFHLKNKRFPKSEEDITSCRSNFPSKKETTLKKFELFIKLFSLEVFPIISFTAGIIAQKAIDLCTQMYSPPPEQIIAECFDFCLTNEMKKHIEDGKKPVEVLQQQIHDMKILCIGAGAIGCEVGNILTEMEIDTLYLVDFDDIALSNLHRQFLFRNEDIGKNKSEVAAEKLEKKNSRTKIIPYVAKFDAESLQTTFFDILKSVDCVVLGVDSVEARESIHLICQAFEKPMIDSGTGGLAGSTQIVIRGISQFKRSIRDPVQEVAGCYEKNVYRLPEHAIHGALSRFVEFFHDSPAIYTVEEYLEGKSKEQWAENLFQELFHKRIEKIIDEWDKPSKKPTPISTKDGSKHYQEFVDIVSKLLDRVLPEDKSRKLNLQYFSKDDPLTVNFVHITSMIYAQIYSLSIPSKTKVCYIAARMASAIITSTSSVASCICVNLFSIKEKNPQFLKNLSMDLNQIVMFRPPMEEKSIPVISIELEKSDPIEKIFTEINKNQSVEIFDMMWNEKEFFSEDPPRRKNDRSKSIYDSLRSIQAPDNGYPLLVEARDDVGELSILIFLEFSKKGESGGIVESAKGKWIS